MEKEFPEEEVIEEEAPEEALENDEISPEEEAFVKGYEDAVEHEKKDEEDEEEV